MKFTVQQNRFYKNIQNVLVNSELLQKNNLKHLNICTNC